MSLQTLGGGTSGVEVSHISAHGVWLLAHEQELFMPYEEFPWFREATVQDVLNVEEVAPDHFHWPDLDVDLTTDMIAHPERYPLKAR